MERIATVSLGNAAITAIALVVCGYEIWLYLNRPRREHLWAALVALMAAAYSVLMLIHYNAGPEQALLLSKLESVPLIVVAHSAPLAFQDIAGRSMRVPRWLVVVSAIFWLAMVPTPWLVGTEIAMRDFILLDHPFARRVETPLSYAAELYALLVVVASLVWLNRHGKSTRDARYVTVGASAWAVITFVDALLGALGAPMLLSIFEYGFCLFAVSLAVKDVRHYMAALANRERDFHGLIERSPDAIAVLHENQIAYANPAFFRMMAIEDGRLPPGLVDIVEPDDAAAVRELIASPTAVAEPVQVRLRRPGQASVEGELVAMISEFAGRSATVVMARDVSARRELTARMMEMDRMITIGTLAACVGHEINNPLAYVLLNLEETRDSLASDATHARSSVDAALDGAQRIAETVRGLSRFSHRDTAYGLLAVREVVDSAVALSANEVKHRAQLVVDVEHDLYVEANDTRLAQVLVNLLVNAAHAIPVGHKDDNLVRLDAFAEGSRIVIEVNDTGVGIEQSSQARIFDAFYSTKPAGQGTGLGLGICKASVEEIGGSISVRSRVGEGATFRVELPAAERRSVSSAPPASARTVTTSRARLLIVDDEPQILRSITRALRDDATVVVASNARDALAIVARDGPIDLVLSDLMMPNGSGIELYEGLAQSHPELAERMLFITGGVFTPEVVAFRERVDNVFLHKPVNLDVLRQHLYAAVTPDHRDAS